ncbi:MAG: HD-GYP domain-containing protein [Bacillota bacterium]
MWHWCELRSLRASDILARIGGDEFAAILPHADEKTGEIICDRIRDNVARFNQTCAELPLSLSIGVAYTVNKNISLTDILKQADDLMYRDKLSRSAGARNKIIEALLVALAERDFSTEGHTRRLAELCQKVGKKCGLTSQQLSNIAMLSQAHDLGKVGIPDHILFKKGPLSEEEWEIMRTHPEKGYRIAAASPDLSVVADLIMKHHERWDGRGYPLGLIGKEIPVECRILAVLRQISLRKSAQDRTAQCIRLRRKILINRYAC